MLYKYPRIIFAGFRVKMKIKQTLIFSYLNVDLQSFIQFSQLENSRRSKYST